MIEEKIGAVAGAVWRKLSENGPMSTRDLRRRAGFPADLTNQAIGWLAREGKLAVDEGGKGKGLLRLRG